MRVVSWNIQYGIEAATAAREIAESADMRDFDVLLLQEMDEPGTATVAEAFSANYTYATTGLHANTGRDFGNAARSATHAVVGVGDHDVSCYSVHTEIPLLSLARRIEQFAAVAHDVGWQPFELAVVGGDFNTVTARGVRALADTLRGVGLEKVSSTTPSYRRRGRNLILDHIFASGFADATSSGVVEGTTASDHAPIWEGRVNGVLVGTVEATLLILLVTVLLGPIVAERFRVPGIVGLIFGGTLFGPYVLDWISAGGLVDDLGAIGILYLMFLAGISFDIRAFQENRTSAIAYGLLGFFIPFLLSAIVMMAAFGVGLLPAALVGAMWASNTLVAYPEIQTAGLQNNRAASAAVSAGVVADLLSLTVLAFVTSTTVIESDPLPAPFDGELFDLTDIDLSTFDFEPSTPDPTLPLLVALPVLVGFCLWLLPKIGERFFVRVGRSRMQRFVFALAAMSAGACVALIGGVEGLIGAFLAGLGLNRLVPNRGSLMERLEFVGTAVFVPTFLVSIGLNIDPALLIDRDTLLLGLVFTAFVIVGKCVAAGITGAIFGFTGNEIGMMSSLSFGQ
ncbi:nhaS5, partial [Symbiodinium sp. KB8]